jgi:urea transport system permease protein
MLKTNESNLTNEAPDSARSQLLYRASQTFLARSLPSSVIFLRIFSISAVVLFFFLVVPLLTAQGLIPDYRLNFLGKYFCYTLVALGIDLIWGYTGLLSLCQALFFCLGGYAMAMHLSLKEGGGDVRPEYHDIPQFMFFNNVKELPMFWKPFTSLTFSIGAGILLPALVATIFGFFILRSRVRGVYFAIITQAVAWGAWLLISRNEMLLGGTNGLTNFYKPFNESTHWIIGLYLLTLTIVALSYLLCLAITRSRLGRVLVAVRDKETRLYFAGYKPYAFKVFAFALGAALAGIGGMLYSPQVGIITPQNMNVEASIMMVIWVAMGGRGKLWGAIFGALLVNVTISSISSDLPSLWLFVQGAMFLAVVLLFPDGFVGLWAKMETKIAAHDFLGAAMIALPFLVVVLFVIAEVLGGMPASLHSVAIHSEQLGDIQWKYLALIAILAASGALQMLINRMSTLSKNRAALLPSAQT